MSFHSFGRRYRRHRHSLIIDGLKCSTRIPACSLVVGRCRVEHARGIETRGREGMRAPVGKAGVH